MVDTAQPLPSADDILDQAAPVGQASGGSPAPKQLPSADAILDSVKPEQSLALRPVTGALKTVASIFEIEKAFGHSFKEAVTEGDPLAGATPDFDKTMEDMHLNAFNAFIRPAASAIDATYRLAGGAFAGLQGSLYEVGHQLGSERIGRDLALAPEAMMAFHVPEPVVRGVANDATLSDEVYLGTQPKTKEQDVAAYKAAAALKAKEDYMAAQRGLVNTVQGPAVHDMAREMEPELFNEKHRLEARQLVLRDAVANPESFGKEYDEKIADLQARSEKYTRAPTNLEGEELRQAVAENTRRGAEIDAQVRALGSREDYIKAATEDARQEIQKNDYRLRDVSADPRIRAAYQEAGKKLAAWEPPPLEPAAPELPVEAPPKGPWENAPEAPPKGPWENAPEGRSVEDQHRTIVDDIVKKATAKGYGADEARASAEVLARQYRYLADLYGGVRGTAEDFYNKYAPDIIGQGERIGKAKELQSIAGKYHVTDDGRRIIRLMDSADQSTLVHEGAHHFLDMLKRLEAEKDAPAQLRADMDMLRMELGVGRNKIFRTAHEERFARGFETYLREGHAPSKELIPLFQKFEKWLTAIYNTVKNLPKVKISDTVRDFFDRTLEPNSALRNNPRSTVIAREEPGKAIASVHKADAETTPKSAATKTADNIEKEIDATVNLYNPEVRDAIKQAEAGDVAETAPSHPESGAESGTGIAGPSVAQEPGTVPGSGGGAQAQSPWKGKRPEPIKPVTVDQQPANPNARLGRSKSGLVDKAGNIRLDLLNTTEDVDAALREVAEENAGFIDQRRGVIPNGLSLDLADALGLDPSHLDMARVGQATNAEGIVARVKLLIQAARETVDAAKSGDAQAYVLAKERQKMIQGHVSGITAEAGRALQIFQALKNIEGYDEATALSKFLAENDKGKTLFQLQEEMGYAAKLKTPQQVAKFMQDSKRSKFENYMRFYYVNALISGPITHMHYAVGNAVMALWTPLVRIPTASLVGSVRESLTGRAEADRVYLGEAGAQLYAMGKGSRDGLMAAIDSFKTGQMPTRGNSLLKGSTAGPATMPTPIPGIVGQALGVPGKSVQAIHALFYTIRYEQNIAGMAYREAMKSGLEGEAFNAKVAQLTKSPTKEMMEFSSSDALKEMYMDPGKYDSWKNTVARVADANLASKVVVPFAKVGLNITSNAWMDQSLLGLFSKGIRDNLSGKNGGAVRDMQIAKIATGTALMGATVMMAMEGNVTGDGPTDPKQYAVWRLTHQPNSIKIGSVSVSYRGLGSLAMLMRTAANMAETAQGWEGEDGDKLAVSALEGITRGVFDETFMVGVKDLTDAIYHPKEYGPRYLQNLATNWLPYSVGMGQMARQIDPYSREVRSHGAENLWGILDAARARIPGVSEGLQPRVDVFGNPIKNGSTYDQYANDPVVQKLEELHMGIPHVERKITNVPLTDAQHHDYAQLAGQLTKQSLDMIVTPEFSYMSRESQILQINKAASAARDNARSIIKMEYTGSDNDIVEKAVDAKIKLFTP